MTYISFRAYNPESIEVEKKELFELIDKVLLSCPEDSEFSLEHILNDIETNIVKANYYKDKVGKYLREFKYIDGKYFIQLTIEGRRIRDFGGHIKYTEFQKEDFKRKNIKEDLEIHQLRWFVKTKWWPHIFSGLAVLISIGALIISIIKDK